MKFSACFADCALQLDDVLWSLTTDVLHVMGIDLLCSVLHADRNRSYTILFEDRRFALALGDCRDSSKPAVFCQTELWLSSASLQDWHCNALITWATPFAVSLTFFVWIRTRLVGQGRTGRHSYITMFFALASVDCWTTLSSVLY